MIALGATPAEQLRSIQLLQRFARNRRAAVILTYVKQQGSVSLGEVIAAIEGTGAEQIVQDVRRLHLTLHHLKTARRSLTSSDPAIRYELSAKGDTWLLDYQKQQPKSESGPG